MDLPKRHMIYAHFTTFAVLLCIIGIEWHFLSSTFVLFCSAPNKQTKKHNETDPLSPLYLLLLVRLGGYIVNLYGFYHHGIFTRSGNWPLFFTSSGVQLPSHDRGQFHYRRTAFISTLNMDGTPITSKSHTHPSHSQTSRLLTSSLSLGVPVPRVTQCTRGV